MSSLTTEQNKLILEELLAIQQHRKVLPLFTQNPISESVATFSCLNDNAMRHYASLQMLFMDKNFTSHRKILGPLIIFFKKKCNKIFNKLAIKILGPQLIFNQEMCNLALLVKIQNDRIDNLEHLLKALKDQS